MTYPVLLDDRTLAFWVERDDQDADHCWIDVDGLLVRVAKTRLQVVA